MTTLEAADLTSEQYERLLGATSRAASVIARRHPGERIEWDDITDHQIVVNALQTIRRFDFSSPRFGCDDWNTAINLVIEVTMLGREGQPTTSRNQKVAV